MNRFFIDDDQIFGDKIEILGPDVRHISGSLRLEEGEKIELVSSDRVYICEIADIEKDVIQAKILEDREFTNEPKKKIKLYQALGKSSKFDEVVQKCTEIGVSEFFPLETERTIVRLEGKKKEKRQARWQKIADEAAKQSKRDILPRVGELLSFKQMLKELEGKDNIIVAYEAEEGNYIRNIMDELVSDDIHLIIGPEGGFSEDEISKIKEIGGRSVSLGPRILRTENAGLAASAIILYEFEEL